MVGSPSSGPVCFHQVCVIVISSVTRHQIAGVLSVGCLVDSGGNRWVLNNASEPVRTRDSFKRVDKEIKASQERALGQASFRLADAENFDAAIHAGKKIQVKGILVRAPAGNRINVNSIEPIGESCQ